VKVVKRMFEQYVRGLGFKAITDGLNRDGIEPPRGPKWAARCHGQWSTTTVRAVLVNPAYRGAVVWNRRTDARFHRISQGVAVERHARPGRRMDDNPEEDWVVVEGAHEALVSPATWHAAQAQLAGKFESASQRGLNPRVPRPKTPRALPLTGPKARFLLSGLVTCGRCGGRYEGISQRCKTTDAEGNKNKTYFYACGSAIRKGPTVCSFGQVPQKALEDAVVNTVLKYYEENGLNDEVVARKAIEQLVGERRKVATATLDKLARRLHKVESTARRLLDNMTAVSRTFVDKQLTELADEKRTIEGEMAAAQSDVVDDAQVGVLAAGVSDCVAGFRTAVVQGDDAARVRDALLQGVTGCRLHAAAGRVEMTVRDIPSVRLDHTTTLTTRV
jgi:site-specific DNA recombinase